MNNNQNTMTNTILEISQLVVQKENSKIIDGLDLEITNNSINVIMGPNGSGKTTLLNSIMGSPDYFLSGTIKFNTENITNTPMVEHALMGIYMSNQAPIEIQGLSHASFLKAALNAKKRYAKEEELDEFEFLKKIKDLAQEFKFEPKDYIKRGLNEGFSGGERKRNELLQIALLDPNLILLDEIDSGLDIEMLHFLNLKIKQYYENGKTIILISHNPESIRNLPVNSIYIMKNGKIKNKFNKSILPTVIQNGFSWI